MPDYLYPMHCGLQKCLMEELRTVEFLDDSIDLGKGLLPTLPNSVKIWLGLLFPDKFSAQSILNTFSMVQRGFWERITRSGTLVRSPHEQEFPANRGSSLSSLLCLFKR
jgi:hypothetical protein